MNDKLVKALTIVGIGTFIFGFCTLNKKDSPKGQFNTVAEALSNESEYGYDLLNDQSICILYDKDVLGNEQYHVVKKITAPELNNEYRSKFNGIPMTYHKGDGLDITTRYGLEDADCDYAYFNLLDGTVISVVNATKSGKENYGNQIINVTPVAPVLYNYLEVKDRYTQDDIKTLYNKINDKEEAKTLIK